MTEKPEKILTLHPDPEKKGTNLDKAKYDQMRQAVIDVLGESPCTPTELMEKLENNMKNFDGKIGWYMMAIKLDLEARKIVGHDRKTRQINLA